MKNRVVQIIALLALWASIAALGTALYMDYVYDSSNLKATITY